jgi:hypothetical protein
MKEIREKQESRARSSRTFELVWSEQLVRSAIVQAKDEREARRKWSRGDPEVWDCSKEWGSKPMPGTLEIEEVKACL